MSNEAPTASKAFWKSKTLWVMILSILSTTIPAVDEWVKTNPVPALQALAAVAILVRFVTHGKISLGWGASDGGGGVVAPLMLLGCTLIGVIGFSQVACSSLPTGVTGSIYYLDGNTGAKGGLSFANGKASGRVTVPLLDPDTGKEVGRAEIALPIMVEAAK